MGVKTALFLLNPASGLYPAETMKMAPFSFKSDLRSSELTDGPQMPRRSPRKWVISIQILREMNSWTTHSGTGQSRHFDAKR
jgi:hypothetical protein